MPPRLLQVCNVGEICGGTAACAWSVTRALPEFEHVVAFLSPIGAGTQAAFPPCELRRCSRVDVQLVTEARADLVLLHNTPPCQAHGRWNVPTILYAHSFTNLAAADRRVYCSRWLAARYGASVQDVCWQGVPRPPQNPRDNSPKVSELVVGRLCTPDARKWPSDVLLFYRALAARCPFVRWEFVGCPRGLREALFGACGGRAAFWDAGWERRALYGTWDALVYHHPWLTESFGRTVAESMRAGCVPVVDRRGGFCEQLDAGGGCLCETRDDFAAAIERLREGDVRRTMSHQARRIANERWSLEAFGRRLRGRFHALATIRPKREAASVARLRLRAPH